MSFDSNRPQKLRGGQSVSSTDDVRDLGSRRAAQQQLELRSVQSINEMKNLPVAFGVVSKDGLSPPPTYSSSPAHSARSTAAYERQMRNAAEAHRLPISVDSLADIHALPSLADQPRARTPTVNKRAHTVESMAEISQLPSFTGSESTTNSLEPTNSDYAYYPGAFVVPAEEVYLTDSSYCYIADNGQYKDFIVAQPIVVAQPVLLAPSLVTVHTPNPYVHVDRYNLISSESTLSIPTSSVETISDWAHLPDVFTLTSHPEGYFPTPVAPANVVVPTVVQELVAAVVEEIVPAVVVQEVVQPIVYAPTLLRSDECLNKRALSVESALSVAQLPSVYEEAYDVGEQVIRDYSRQSLEDLRLLPSISSYKLVTPAEQQLLYYPSTTLLQ